MIDRQEAFVIHYCALYQALVDAQTPNISIRSGAQPINRQASTIGRYQHLKTIHPYQYSMPLLLNFYFIFLLKSFKRKMLATYTVYSGTQTLV